jgi:hypothetical protein
MASARALGVTGPAAFDEDVVVEDVIGDGDADEGDSEGEGEGAGV